MLSIKSNYVKYINPQEIGYSTKCKYHHFIFNNAITIEGKNVGTEGNH